MTDRKTVAAAVAAPFAGLLLATAFAAHPGSAARVDVDGGVVQYWALSADPFAHLGVDLSDCGPTSRYDEVYVGTGGNDVLGGSLAPKASRGTAELGGYRARTGGSRLVIGLGGNDVLIGSNENDCLVGGAGHDILLGRSGADTLVGGAGGDLLVGGLGNDILVSGDDHEDLCVGLAPASDVQRGRCTWLSLFPGTTNDTHDEEDRDYRDQAGHDEPSGQPDSTGDRSGTQEPDPPRIDTGRGEVPTPTHEPENATTTPEPALEPTPDPAASPDSDPVAPVESRTSQDSDLATGPSSGE